MTTLIFRLFGIKKTEKTQQKGFFGMSSSKKKQVFRKVIREANEEQREMVMRYPEKFEALKKRIIK